MSDKRDGQLMFGELLAHLRQHGFPIGIDHYLRLQELLDKVGDRCAPEDLRTVLCPIFASTRNQQEQFYRAFDSYFSLFEPVQLKEPAKQTALQARPRQVHRLEPGRPPVRPPQQRKWLYILAPVVMVALIVGLVLLAGRNPTSNQNASQQANANSPQSQANANTGAPPIIEVPPPVSQPVYEPPGTGMPAQPPTYGPNTAQPIQTPPSQASPQQPAAGPGFYNRYRIIIYLAAVLLPLIIFLLYEWYRRRLRRRVLEQERGRKPPYSWPVRAQGPLPKLFESEQFYTAARLLRRRQVAEFYRLDVEASVAATVASLGYPTFRYKSASKPPEYLALIDRASFRDHQARLFDELTRALETEGVFIARYFYEDDPRVCRNENGEESLHLNELQHRYGTHRLLIFGDGSKLVDSLTGKLEGWTTMLMGWQDRAVLTPEPPARWGLRERALGQHFVLLPATLDGLQSLVDYFEAAVIPDMRIWARNGNSAASAPATAIDFDRPITTRMLREHLGKEVFEWLCACAIYPELHWDLTLYLGSLPSLGNNLVREQNLLRLVHLPWFRTGVMPDNLRWLLINELPPEKARAVRTSLIQLLEKSPPPKASVAEEGYRLNLAAQRWLHSRSRQRLRELLELMRRLPRSVAMRDRTLVRYLESAPAPPLNIALPARIRRLVYQSGLPAFGLKTSARMVVTLLTIGLAWATIMALAPKPQTTSKDLGSLIASALPAPTPELYPSYPTDYTAQNPALNPMGFPTDPNANTAGFPPAQQFPQATIEQNPNTPPAYTPPASGGGGGGHVNFPRTPKGPANTESKPTATATPAPTPTPFPPLKQTAQTPSGQQAPPADGAITPPPALTPEQLAQSQELLQQKAPNKVSKGGLRPEDRARLTATQAFQQGEQLRAQGTKELLPQVVNKYEAALAAYRSAQDRAGEAAMLNNLGVVYNSLGEREKALEFYRQSLTARLELNDRAGQSVVLNNVGRIYDGIGDKNVAQDFYDQSRSVWQTDTSPDKKMKATVSDTRQIKLLDATTGQDLKTLSGHTANVFEVVFSPDGKRLASAGDDGTIRIWDVASGEEVASFGSGATGYHLSFSADGKTITATRPDGGTRVWQTDTGKLVSTTEPPAPAQSQSPSK